MIVLVSIKFKKGMLAKLTKSLRMWLPTRRKKCWKKRNWRYWFYVIQYYYKIILHFFHEIGHIGVSKDSNFSPKNLVLEDINLSPSTRSCACSISILQQGMNASSAGHNFFSLLFFHYFSMTNRLKYYFKIDEIQKSISWKTF